MPRHPRSIGLLAIIGPGLLVAATGVGTGDLASAGFAGMRLGTAVLWAVLLGAVLKLALTEGLARWQLATGETVLEGAVTRLRWLVSVPFALYFVVWSYVTGAALISASGITAHALLEPLGLFEHPEDAKLVLGAVHSVLVAALVWTGGYRVFERAMAVCIAVMFVCVIATAVMCRPDLGDVAKGLVVPTIPDLGGDGLPWTIALVGGVGGTLTIICYGYWIREEGRTDTTALRTCRIDLGVGYAMTALFGIAMIIIAQGIDVQGGGARLVAALADELGTRLGPAGRWLFVIGAYAAVVSSLLGVWQSVPYVFADFVRLHRSSRKSDPVSTRSAPYRAWLVAIALVPLIQVRLPFEHVQLVYAVLGACFLPLLAVVLLVLNGRRSSIGPAHRNGPLATTMLIVTVGFFVAAGVYALRNALG